MRGRGIDADGDLEALVHDAAPDDPEVIRRLRQMYEAGAWVLVESALADLPADLRWLFESGAVTIAQLHALHTTLGAASASDLAAAVDRQQIRGVPGLDATVEYAVAAALFDLRAAVPRVPLGRATALAEPLLAHLRGRPEVAWAEPAGSLRRGEVTVGDIELIAASADPAAVIDELIAWPEVARVLHRSARRLYLLFDRIQIGFRFPAPESAGAVLLAATGGERHVAGLRRLARDRGWALDRSGLADGGRTVAAASEQAIYTALGLSFIVPEIRAGAGEIDAALDGTLPALVDRADIRGDLHMHTSFSDGRDTVDAMVRTCRDLGYEYLAITDHSPSCAASRTLTLDSVKQQADEIAAARERYPGIAILHGCEVDILPDGRLDFPDRVLERFDIVLASLHERAGQDRDQLMRRYDAALQHPLVHLITHPTNRIVPTRPGYDLDYDRLFARAVETGTVVEVDGSPAHLDLDGDLSRKAAAAGAMLAISSDCHRAEALGRQMRLGLTMARRGWLQPHQVVNTRPLADLRALLARKRAR